MKRRALQIIFASGLLGALASGCATGTATRAPSAVPSVASIAQGEPEELTGSYFKQRYCRYGFITDSGAHVMVIDEDAIRRSGAQDVREVLVKTGLNR